MMTEDNVKEIPELSENERELRKHLDVKNKLDCIILDITWKVGEKLVPTKVRIDKNLINYDQIPEALKSNGENPDFHFARCIWGNLQWDSPDKIKSNMLRDIKNHFNKVIEDIHIFKSGHVHEVDCVIITHAQTDEPIIWMKFLRKEITDEQWKNYQESIAGTDAVIMPAEEV